jgi:hypothetical protein
MGSLWSRLLLPECLGDGPDELAQLVAHGEEVLDVSATLASRSKNVPQI